MTEGQVRWHRWVQFAAFASILATIASNAVLAVEPSASIEPQGACVDGWTYQARPGSAANGLPRAVVALDGRPDWVFGVTGPRRSPLRPIALRWQGGAWRDKPVPWSGLSGFMGGDSVSRSNAWAVGWIRSGAYRPIAAHWNGGSWGASTLPSVGGDAALVDVAMVSGGEAWAVGTREASGRVRPLVMHRSAPSGWRIVSIDTGPGQAGLTAVEARPGGGVVAIGWRTIAGVPRPLIAIREAGDWSLSEGAPLGAGSGMLTDIQFRNSTDAFLSGFISAPSGSTRPVIERWDGSSWTEVDAPDVNGVLRGVAVGSDDELAVAGTRLSNDARRSRGFTARRVAGTWAISDLDTTAKITSEMLGVTPIDGGFLAVGNTTNSVRIRKTCGGATAAGTSEPLADADDTARLHPHPDASERRNDATGLMAPPAPAGSLGGIRVRERAADVGLGFVTSSWGVSTADFDQDGWRDVFIGGHTTTSRLMLGGPSGFHQARGTPIEKRDRHGCVVGDVEDDGMPDLYCAHGANRGVQMKGNDLYVHLGIDGSQAAGSFDVLDPFGRGRAVTFLHVDDDQYPELYVTNEPERVDGLPSTNRLYMNIGGGRFRSAPEQGLDVSFGGACATSGDIDHDGDDDLLVCAVERWQGRGPGLRAFRNDGGVLHEATAEMGMPSGYAYDAITADMDGDGDVEIIHAAAGKVVVSGWRGGDIDVLAQIGVSAPTAIAAGDVNGDGDTDLFVLRGGSPNLNDVVLLNDGDGTSFGSVTMPRGAGGVADAVARIDYDKNGLDDFVLTNGYFSRGPVQLFAFYH